MLKPQLALTVKNIKTALYIGLFMIVAMTNARAEDIEDPQAHTEKQIIRVGFGAERPPFVYSDHVGGLEIELVTAIIKQMGYEMDADFIPNARGYQYLEQQRIDLYTTLTEESKGHAYLTKPYIDFENVLISKPKNQSIQSFDELADTRLTAFQNAKFFIPEIAAIKDKTALYFETAAQRTQVLLLYRDRVDYVFSERRIFEHYYKQAIAEGDLPAEGFVYQIHNVIEPTHYSAGFNDPKLRDEFNDALDVIIADGTYKRIMDKYDIRN